MARDVAGYLAEQQRKSTGDLAQEWATLEDLYNRKLWHQLTLKLGTFVKNPAFAHGDALVKMYNNFIADFDHRINQLSLVEIIIPSTKQIKDHKEALEYMDKIQEKVKSDKEAVILCMTIKGQMELKQNNMPATKDIVEAAQKLLDGLDGVTTVHGRFYNLTSSYHKLMGNHADYYRDALRYLGCVELDDISAAEQIERAFNLALAAVLGKGVYNFGELLMHPVLNKLRATEKLWLVDLLYAFNAGNIGKFDDLKKHWAKQPDLSSHEIEMRQKISLLCLMEMTFRRPATNRQLTFKEISEEARLPENEVELLVMKALSLGLVKGSIDQVDAKVHMTWVQPRVLDREQIGSMVKRLDRWLIEVKSMENMVENKAADILT